MLFESVEDRPSRGPKGNSVLLRLCFVVGGFGAYRTDTYFSSMLGVLRRYMGSLVGIPTLAIKSNHA